MGAANRLVSFVATISLAFAVVSFACSSDETTNATPGDAGASDASSDTTRRDSASGEEDAAPGCNAGAAPDPVSYSVTVIEPPNGTLELAGATLELVKRSDRSVITTATSGADGKAKLTAPTGGVALDALLRVTAPPAEAGPRTPIIVEHQYGIQKDEATTGLGVPPTSLLESSASAVGVTFDPTKTMVHVHVGTCTGSGMSGAKVAVEGATVFYNRNNPLALESSATETGASGLATAFNVAPGATKITVTLNDGTTVTHETNTLAGEIHLVLIGH